MFYVSDGENNGTQKVAYWDGSVHTLKKGGGVIVDQRDMK